jgi:hypothetical protein
MATAHIRVITKQHYTIEVKDEELRQARRALGNVDRSEGFIEEFGRDGFEQDSHPVHEVLVESIDEENEGDG